MIGDYLSRFIDRYFQLIEYCLVCGLLAYLADVTGSRGLLTLLAVSLLMLLLAYVRVLAELKTSSLQSEGGGLRAWLVLVFELFVIAVIGLGFYLGVEDVLPLLESGVGV